MYVTETWDFLQRVVLKDPIWAGGGQELGSWPAVMVFHLIECHLVKKTLDVLC